MKKSITKTKILFILLILIIGIIGYKNIPVQSNEITPVNDEKPQKNLGIPTEIVKVTKENLVEKISYIGTIQSKETVLVSPKIPAEIVELNIAEGDYVKKGEILARLDDSNIRAKLKTIETKIEKTKINLEYLSGEEEKYKILRDEGAIAKSVYDKIKHEKDMAEAQIKELYATKDELIISLEDTLIKSPINGVVRTLNYSIHELAMVGKPLTIIDDVSNLLVKVKVSESDLKKINKETSVLLTISGTQQKVRSRVSKIMPSMNPKTRIGEVEIADLELEDTNNIVLGSSVQAEFVINEENNTLAIPMDSIKQLIEFDIAQDDSVFTLQMVNNMTSSVLISIVLTILIIMLFISAVNQSLVVSISMPLVFLTTLGLMKLFGMKMDLVALSALILSIGFVVDASVIVVENIMTHYNDLNKDIVSAAIDGTREIAVPSISGALTTLVVLVPLLFIKGFVGAMFRPLSLTLIFAISSSIVIALVIIPLFTVLLNKFKLTKTEKVIEIFSKPFNRMMNSLLNGYVKLLKLAINNKGKTYITILILLVLSGRFLISNGIEMLPKFDSGVTFVSIEMEPGTTLQETSRTINIIEKILDKEKNVISYDTQIGYEKDSNLLGDFGVMGTNQALMTINLNTRKEREETIWEFQERLRNYISEIPGIKRFVVKEQGGTAVSGSSAPLDIKISGSDQEILYDLATKLEGKIEKVEGTTNIYKSFNLDNLQINIMMDNARIQELGLSSAAISRQIFNRVEGITNTEMDTSEVKNVDISVKYKNEYIKSVDKLLDINIDTPLGVKVPLRELAKIKINERANIITKEDLEHTINILGYTHNRAFSHIVKDINKIIDDFPVPKGYSVTMSGEQEELGKSMKDMIFSLLLAVIFVYLVLVPQFKSFVHPITVMSGIPLVVIGIAPSLGIAVKYISMPVLLGFILLAGTVVNNSILLIDFVIAFRNNRQELTIEEALTAAVKARFRPIMMTALSDVAGMLPLALQLALGAERFSPLAITVIGGILAATFLTMIVIPVIYATFDGIQQRITKGLETV